MRHTIDLIVLVRKLNHDLPAYLIVNATYCSIIQVTLKGALSELSRPSDEFPQILGGYRKILPLHDPFIFARESQIGESLQLPNRGAEL